MQDEHTVLQYYYSEGRDTCSTVCVLDFWPTDWAINPASGAVVVRKNTGISRLSIYAIWNSFKHCSVKVRGLEGSRSSVIVCWTTDQFVEQLILHLGHGLYSQNVSLAKVVPSPIYPSDVPVESWPKTPSFQFSSKQEMSTAHQIWRCFWHHYNGPWPSIALQCRIVA